MFYQGKIYEYDIVAAAYNIVVNECTHIIDDFERVTLLSYSSDKNKRNVYIGKLQRKYKELAKELSKKYKIILDLFITLNDLKDKDILYKTKDSLIVAKECKKLSISYYTFVQKSFYTHAISIKILHRDMQIFFNQNNNEISIKGLTNYLEEHKKIGEHIIKLVINFINEKNRLSLFTIYKKILPLLLKDCYKDDDKVIVHLDDGVRIKCKFGYMPKDYYDKIDRTGEEELLKNIMSALLKEKE